MIELKNKLNNYLLIDGKKAVNEKKVKMLFKKYNVTYKNKISNVFQFIIYQSSFIFKCNTKTNSTYFFVSKARTFFALKQIVKLNFFNKNLEEFQKELQVQKKLQNKFVLNKKLLHFYRWTTQ